MPSQQGFLLILLASPRFDGYPSCYDGLPTRGLQIRCAFKAQAKPHAGDSFAVLRKLGGGKATVSNLKTPFIHNDSLLFLVRK